MIDKEIEAGITELRNIIYNKIQARLASLKSKKKRVNLVIAGSIDDDRYDHMYVKSLYLDENQNVIVRYKDDDEDSYDDDFILFPTDEMILIYSKF